MRVHERRPSRLKRLLATTLGRRVVITFCLFASLLGMTASAGTSIVNIRDGEPLIAACNTLAALCCVVTTVVTLTLFRDYCKRAADTTRGQPAAKTPKHRAVRGNEER